MGISELTGSSFHVTDFKIRSVICHCGPNNESVISRCGLYCYKSHNLLCFLKKKQQGTQFEIADSIMESAMTNDRSNLEVSNNKQWPSNFGIPGGFFIYLFYDSIFEIFGGTCPQLKKVYKIHIIFVLFFVRKKYIFNSK